MNFSRKAVLTCAAMFGMLTASSVMAKKIDNAEYKQWAKFKPGAMAKVENSSTTAGQTSKGSTTTKLVELTPEKAVVEVSASMDMMGQKMDMPAQKREIPAQMEVPDNAPTPPADTTTPKVDMKTNQETVKVGDKEVKCTVTETDSDINGMKAHTKSWTSDEVPGSVVKMETKMTGAMESTTSMTLVDFKTGG